MTHQGLKIISS